MAESQKTVPSDESVEAFIAAVPDDARREDALELSRLLAEWTGEPPVMNLVVYLVGGVQDRYPKLLEQLGPHKVGKGCLYLKRLDDANAEALRALVDRTVRVHRGADRA
jgi:hypothetical protein